MSVTVAVLQHVAHEGPGWIPAALRAEALAPVVVRTDLGEALPRPDDLAALVVLGGPQRAGEASLAAERDLIAACAGRRLPVLGVGLGARLLAVALGGGAAPGPWAELGFGTVELTEHGLADPLLSPEGPLLPALRWHDEALVAPPGATVLAGSPAYPHLAFRLGTSYGLQLRVELDSAGLHALCPHLPPGVRIDPTWAARAIAAGQRVLRRWATLVAPAGRVALGGEDLGLLVGQQP